MKILSDVLSGAFTIVATMLGFILGLVSGAIAWWWKARGIRHMLADEVEINLNAWKSSTPGPNWPVRSVYIWESLQPLVPGVLSRVRVKALMHFYYCQAKIYKKRDRGEPWTDADHRTLREYGEAALKELGQPQRGDNQ